MGILLMIFFMAAMFKITGLFFRILGAMFGWVLGMFGWMILASLAVPVFGLAFFVLPVILLVGVIALVKAAV